MVQKNEFGLYIKTDLGLNNTLPLDVCDLGQVN